MEQFDNFKYQISEDRTTVTLSTPPVTLTAAQFDELIHSLSMMRAMLTPEHPLALPSPDKWVYHPIDGWQVLAHPDAKGTPAEEGFLLLVRSAGLGWAQGEIPPAQAAALHTFLGGTAATA